MKVFWYFLISALLAPQAATAATLVEFMESSASDQKFFLHGFLGDMVPYLNEGNTLNGEPKSPEKVEKDKALAAYIESEVFPNDNPEKCERSELELISVIQDFRKTKPTLHAETIIISYLRLKCARAAANKITVSFPGEPVVQAKTIQTPMGPLTTAGHIYSEDGFMRALMVTSPVNIKEDELAQRYIDSKKELLSKPNRKLIKEESFNVGPYSGARFVIYEEGRLKTEQRIIWIDGSIHTLIVQCDWDKDLEPVATSFFDSIKLK